MNIQEFNLFLKLTSKGRENSDIQKIKMFIDWCNKNNYEEILLRLSSEKDAGLGDNRTIDFTTKRIIITKKSFMKKFLDVGYVAGMGPFPYIILSEKKHTSKIKDSAKLDVRKIMNKSDFEYSLDYDLVDEVIASQGSSSVVRNMFGSFITKNYLTIIADKKRYEYILPAKKNGDFYRMTHWLQVLPVKVSVVY